MNSNRESGGSFDQYRQSMIRNIQEKIALRQSETVSLYAQLCLSSGRALPEKVSQLETEVIQLEKQLSAASATEIYKEILQKQLEIITIQMESIYPELVNKPAEKTMSDESLPLYTPSGQKTDGMRRFYMKVPFSDKDEAKSLGAKYEASTKRWFYEAPEPDAKFSKWKIIEEKQISLKTSEPKQQEISKPKKKRFYLDVPQEDADKVQSLGAVQTNKGDWYYIAVEPLNAFEKWKRAEPSLKESKESVETQVQNPPETSAKSTSPQQKNRLRAVMRVSGYMYFKDCQTNEYYFCPTMKQPNETGNRYIPVMEQKVLITSDNLYQVLSNVKRLPPEVAVRKDVAYNAGEIDILKKNLEHTENGRPLGYFENEHSDGDQSWTEKKIYCITNTKKIILSYDDGWDGQHDFTKEISHREFLQAVHQEDIKLFLPEDESVLESLMAKENKSYEPQGR